MYCNVILGNSLSAFFLSSFAKPSEEKEIVDLMLKKIYSFFGIRYDDKKDPRGPDTTGSSGPTLNTSRNLLS